LKEAGVGHTAINRDRGEHLIEWLIYEEDGSRRSLPRNSAARDVGAEGSSTLQPFYDVCCRISPSATDIHPPGCPPPAVHLCPQVGSRHRDSFGRTERSGCLDFGRSLAALQPQARPRRPCRIPVRRQRILPSTQEIKPILDRMSPDLAVEALFSAGFPRSC